MKRLVILGAGESGTGSAVLAKQKGYEVFVSDKSEIKQKYRSGKRESRRFLKSSLPVVTQMQK